MLSHVLGRTTHAAALKAADLSGRLDEYEDKLVRQADRHKRAIERRDRQIAALTADLFAARRKSRQPQKGLSTSIAGPNAPRVCWSPENTP